MTTKHIENWDILSDMIRASAKSTASYVPLDNPTVFCIRFQTEKSARAFQDAFESFAHASKKTVRSVHRKKSLK